MESSIESEFNLSSLSFISGVCVPGSLATTSTPKKAVPKRLNQRPALQKVPPKPKGPIIGTCHLCGKVYRSAKYFQKHKVDHKLKEEAAKFPDQSRLLEARTDLITSTLRDINEFLPIGKCGRESKILIGSMLEDIDKYEPFFSVVFDKFIAKLCNVKFCMPSSLLSNVYKVIDDVTTEEDFRKWVIDTIMTLVDSVSKEAINSVFLDFVFKLGNKLIHFIAQSIMADSQPQSSVQLSISEDERQTIHYVAGAIIRQYTRKARRYMNNRFGKNIDKAIKNCILGGDVVGVAANCDKYWTEFCNRGALNFVGPLFLDFIIAVVDILVSVELPDGSLFYEDVQQKLLLSPARSLWDKLIGSALDEDDSIKFMRGVVQSFTATYGRGTSLKLMNKEMERPKVTVPLRKRLAASHAQQS